MTALDSSKFHDSILKWYRSRARVLPWRELWRVHQDPWHIWVSEIMLQQTVIKAVLPVYDRFLKNFPQPRDLAKADTETVRLAVRGLGYYRRFDFLHKAAKHLVETRQNRWPTSYEEWLELPGIGDYTASAISSITLGAPHGVVDGNVERVWCRIFDIRTAPNLPELKLKFKQLMNQLVALGSPGDFNQAVMELGQTTCTPASPACELCPVTVHCTAKRKGSQHLAPGVKARPEFSDVRMALLIPTQGESALLVRRPAQAKFLKNTFGFPTVLFHDKQGWIGDGFELPEAIKIKLEKSHKSKTIKHNITKHKIRAEILLLDASSSADRRSLESIAKQSGDAFTTMSTVAKANVEESLVSNLDRKAWHKLQ